VAATDTSLNREVAVKVLPEEIAADPNSALWFALTMVLRRNGR
jgi:hypothetical protein